MNKLPVPQVAGVSTLACTLLTGVLLAGCATTPASDRGYRKSGCPMGQTLYCDGRHRAVSTEALQCRCASNRDLNTVLRRH